tara:strand:+ start:440 stop:883 length:444 start_codon:yes stop_codon:yes gene_type:complete
MPFYIAIFLSFFIVSCNSTIQKSGVIETDRFESNFEGLNKIEVIERLGAPSSSDALNNSLIYISETAKKTNIFNNKIISRNVYVIKFDDNNIFNSINFYDINQNNEISISKKTTSDEILKTGWIERIFGGVGKKDSLSSIPSANIGD